MNVSATQNSLEKFLAIKKAAEQRMQFSGNLKTAPAGRTQESFFDIIKSVRKKDDNTIIAGTASTAAPAPAQKTQSADKLAAVYGMNRLLSQSLSESPAREAIVKTRHLGKLFDAVA
jgi:hypothetical protein